MNSSTIDFSQFTAMIIVRLAAKNAHALDGVIGMEVARLDHREDTTVVRYLARADVDLVDLEADTPVIVQMLWARASDCDHQTRRHTRVP